MNLARTLGGCMHECHIDIENNRFYMKLEGFYTADRLSVVTDEFIAEADKLQDGYAVINDISNLRVTTDEATKQLERMRDYALSRNIKIVIRIVGNKLSKMQLNDIADRKTYKIVEVSTYDDAIAYLNENGM